MNHDRLLTRVYDKHENKMYYENGGHPSTLLKDYEGDECDFLAVTASGILVDYCHDLRNGCVIEYSHIIPFKDRFIPMLCSGRKDQNKKLIYTADIVATSNNKYLVYWDEKSVAFWFKRLDNECELLIDDFSCEIEIIGNEFENKEIYDQIKDPGKKIELSG